MEHPAGRHRHLGILCKLRDGRHCATVVEVLRAIDRTRPRELAVLEERVLAFDGSATPGRTLWEPWPETGRIPPPGVVRLDPRGNVAAVDVAHVLGHAMTEPEEVDALEKRFASSAALGPAGERERTAVEMRFFGRWAAEALAESYALRWGVRPDVPPAPVSSLEFWDVEPVPTPCGLLPYWVAQEAQLIVGEAVVWERCLLNHARIPSLLQSIEPVATIVRAHASCGSVCAIAPLEGYRPGRVPVELRCHGCGALSPAIVRDPRIFELIALITDIPEARLVEEAYRESAGPDFSPNFFKLCELLEFCFEQKKSCLAGAHWPFDRGVYRRCVCCGARPEGVSEAPPPSPAGSPAPGRGPGADAEDAGTC